MTLPSPTTSPNMSATTSISKKYHPCTSMLWSISKTIWIPPSPSAGRAEKESAAPAQ